jgi:hypothetical protein
MKLFKNDDERHAAGAVCALLGGLDRNGHREDVLSRLPAGERALVEYAEAAAKLAIATRGDGQPGATG